MGLVECMSDQDSTVTRTSSDARTGIARHVVASKIFKFSALFLILASTVFQGVDESFNKADDELDYGNISPWLVTEFIFTSLFTIEIVIRILAWPSLRSYLDDRDQKWWNRIDFGFLIAINFETWILPFIFSPEDRHSVKPVRLILLVRITRVLSIFPELSIVLQSVARAMNSVLLIFVFQVCFMWFLSVVLVNWSRSDKHVFDQTTNPSAIELYYYFASTGSCMLTLLQVLIQDGAAEIIRVTSSQSAFMGALIVMFSLTSILMFYNVLIGSICRVVFESTNSERNKTISNALRKWLKKCDKSKKGWLSASDWYRGVPRLKYFSDDVDREKLESARVLATDEFAEETKVDIVNIPSLYVKLSSSVQTQDLLSCQIELSALYDQVQQDVLLNSS